MELPVGALSRRDFLKLAGYGMLGLWLPDFSRFSPSPTFDSDLQGRVTYNTLWSYAAPSEGAKRVEMYWRDLVIPLSGAAISENEEDYNRVWYAVDEKSYVYSGGVQPVSTRESSATSSWV